MTSHKSLSINEPVRSTSSYVRQCLSAVRVISILSMECPDSLPPLPIVPYALSLAMSVAYRQFRQSKLQAHRNRAKEDLKTCCTLLNKLRSAWWSAGAMEDLGRAALSMADRSPAARGSCDRRRGSALYTSAPTDVPDGSTSHVRDTQSPTRGLTMIPSYSQTATPAGHTSTAPSMGSSAAIPGQCPVGNDRPFLSIQAGFDPTLSPDWLNFDTAFENIDTLLGSSGADLSMELLAPFNYEGLNTLQAAMNST